MPRKKLVRILGSGLGRYDTFIRDLTPTRPDSTSTDFNVRLLDTPGRSYESETVLKSGDTQKLRLQFHCETCPDLEGRPVRVYYAGRKIIGIEPGSYRD